MQCWEQSRAAGLQTYTEQQTSKHNPSPCAAADVFPDADTDTEADGCDDADTEADAEPDQYDEDETEADADAGIQSDSNSGLDPEATSAVKEESRPKSWSQCEEEEEGLDSELELFLSDDGDEEGKDDDEQREDGDK